MFKKMRLFSQYSLKGINVSLSTVFIAMRYILVLLEISRKMSY